MESLYHAGLNHRYKKKRCFVTEARADSAVVLPKINFDSPRFLLAFG